MSKLIEQKWAENYVYGDVHIGSFLRGEKREWNFFGDFCIEKKIFL